MSIQPQSPVRFGAVYRVSHANKDIKFDTEMSLSTHDALKGVAKATSALQNELMNAGIGATAIGMKSDMHRGGDFIHHYILTGEERAEYARTLSGKLCLREDNAPRTLFEEYPKTEALLSAAKFWPSMLLKEARLILLHITGQDDKIDQLLEKSSQKVRQILDKSPVVEVTMKSGPAEMINGVRVFGGPVAKKDLEFSTPTPDLEKISHLDTLRQNFGRPIHRVDEA